MEVSKRGYGLPAPNAAGQVGTATVRGWPAPGAQAAAAAPSKPSKYGNAKTEVDGITFDSAREAARYRHLRMLEQAGEIAELRMQVPFVLAEPVSLDGRKKPALRYMADFTYREGGALVVEDVKSAVTAKTKEYRIKRHLMKSVHGIDIKEVR